MKEYQKKVEKLERQKLENTIIAMFDVQYQAFWEKERVCFV